VKIGFHPYTYVRTNVMRSKLLKREDYNKLLKLSLPEITKYLQDRHYRDEVNELGVIHESAALLERALNMSLDTNFTKLRRITKGNLSDVVDAYLRRYDVQNVKAVLRGVATNQRDDAERFLSNAGGYPRSFYEDALRAESVEEAVEILAETGLIDESDGLGAMETEIDKRYYTNLLDITDNLKGSELFKEFVRMEIQILNILTVLRLKKEGVDDEVIDDVLLPGDGVVDELRGLELGEAYDTLLDTKYGELLTTLDVEPEESLINVERALKGHLLQKAELFIHQDILSVNVILGFMFAKEIEVRNLRILVKGKKLDMDEQFIKKELIV
jgi:V/A-type H+-transporting ATPase subunit C